MDLAKIMVSLVNALAKGEKEKQVALCMELRSIVRDAPLLTASTIPWG